jgi:hypothetical protein
MDTNNPIPRKIRPGSIVVGVFDDGEPVARASVTVYPEGERFDAKTWSRPAKFFASRETDRRGSATFPEVPPCKYVVVYEHLPETDARPVDVDPGCTVDVCFDIALGAMLDPKFETERCEPLPCPTPSVGDRVILTPKLTRLKQEAAFEVFAPRSVRREGQAFVHSIERAGEQELVFAFQLPRRDDAPVAGGAAELKRSFSFFASERVPQPIAGNLGVTLTRTAAGPTTDVPLWVVIRKSMEALSFNNYLRFMNFLFCGERDLGRQPEFETQRFGHKEERFRELRSQRLLPFTDADAYRVVKAATEAFVMVNCGVALSDPPFDTPDVQDHLDRRAVRVGPRIGRSLDALWDRYLVPVNGGPETMLPYLAIIRTKLPDVLIKRTRFEDAPSDSDECFGILQEKLTHPCLLELIWSYWHEEGMLVQTMNAITRRFQNVRGRDNDPLGNLEIDPLRPLNNLLWGYIQDEQHRLTVVRRNYEYDHHYGLRLEGRAVRDVRAADTRSKFLEAFHNLLHQCAEFFKQDDDTTVVADGFPVLNALKEVHLILSQGAHNQFGDLPSTARIEMLMQEWLLARPEFREFLPTRIMVAYPEPWMDRVDAMKKLQGWSDTSVLHFRNLGMFGEQIVLSIRYGAWSDVNEPVQAVNWVRFWRAEIQGYTHAYRSVTGVDLTAANVGGAVDFTLPSVHLQRRLAAQLRSA